MPGQVSAPKRYMAASVPRSLRQQRLGHLPASAIIGSKQQSGKNGANLVHDIIMLPEAQFVRMKSNVGMQQVANPGLRAGADFQPGFVMQDTKIVTAPADAIDQDAYARTYFIKEFQLEAWAEAAPVPKSKPPEYVKESVKEAEFTVVDYDPAKDKQRTKDEVFKK